MTTETIYLYVLAVLLIIAILIILVQVSIINDLKKQLIANYSNRLKEWFAEENRKNKQKQDTKNKQTN